MRVLCSVDIHRGRVGAFPRGTLIGAVVPAKPTLSMAVKAAGRALPVARQTFTPVERAACRASTDEGKTFERLSSSVPSMSKANNLTRCSLLRLNIGLIGSVIAGKPVVVDELLLVLASPESSFSPMYTLSSLVADAIRPPLCRNALCLTNREPMQVAVCLTGSSAQ